MPEKDAPEEKQTKSSVRSWLTNGALLAVLGAGLHYVINLSEERGQLRSDVANLTDRLYEARKENDSLKSNVKGLNQELRASALALETSKQSLESARNRSSTAEKQIETIEAEAETWKKLVADDKRCAVFERAINDAERDLSVSEAEVSALRGQRREEAVRKLEQNRNSLDRCKNRRSPMEDL
jgi:chromosome segregation ATPase